MIILKEKSHESPIVIKWNQKVYKNQNENNNHKHHSFSNDNNLNDNANQNQLSKNNISEHKSLNENESFGEKSNFLFLEK